MHQGLEYVIQAEPLLGEDGTSAGDTQGRALSCLEGFERVYILMTDDPIWQKDALNAKTFLLVYFLDSFVSNRGRNHFSISSCLN